MTAALIDALSEFAGVTITVRHELNGGAARLMDTLGVNVIIDATAAPCSRFTVMSRGEPDRVADRICPECRALDTRSSTATGKDVS